MVWITNHRNHTLVLLQYNTKLGKRKKEFTILNYEISMKKVWQYRKYIKYSLTKFPL